MSQANLVDRNENGDETAEPSGRIKAILDASEFVFARSGFAGAGLREIAERAGVAQALIHYHFKTKDGLFEAVTARRSGEINTNRAKLLDELLADTGSVQLEQVVEALFRPTIEVGHSLSSGGGDYSRILVSIANSSDDRDCRLIETHYDPIARKFIDVLCRIVPGLTRKDAVWAYMFSIGVGMTMMARTGRPARLSDGQCDDSNIEEMLDEIVVYVCGGIRALTGGAHNQQ